MADKVDVEATLAKAREKARETWAKAEAEGLFSHFSAFNGELIQPWQYILNDAGLAASPTFQDKALYLLGMAKDEVLSTLQLKTLLEAPPSNEAAMDKLLDTCQTRFKLYNAIGFYLGLTEAILFGIFGHGWFSIVFTFSRSSDASFASASRLTADEARRRPAETRIAIEFLSAPHSRL